MPSTRLDVQGDFPNQLVEVTLDAVPYTLQFQFNDRDGNWYITVWDEQQTTLLGLPTVLVLNWPMFLSSLPGFLYATLPDGLQGRPDDLTAMNLSYYDAVSRAALQAGSLEIVT